MMWVLYESPRLGDPDAVRGAELRIAAI